MEQNFTGKSCVQRCICIRTIKQCSRFWNWEAYIALTHLCAHPLPTWSWYPPLTWVTRPCWRRSSLMGANSTFHLSDCLLQFWSSKRFLILTKCSACAQMRLRTASRDYGSLLPATSLPSRLLPLLWFHVRTEPLCNLARKLKVHTFEININTFYDIFVICWLITLYLLLVLKIGKEDLFSRPSAVFRSGIKCHSALWSDSPQ